MCRTCAIAGLFLAAAVFLAWPQAACAAARARGHAPEFELISMGLLIASGLFFALTCYDRRRGERFCVWIMLQAALAVLAGVLAPRTGGGAWKAAVRLVAYATCASAALGAALHVYALQVQRRLRQSQSLGQSLSHLDQLDQRLAEATANQSERFHSVYDREAARIEELRSLGLAALWKPAQEDTERPDRLHMQVRYLDYSEQAAFEHIGRLLQQREALLVHISPYLKSDYLLSLWCDVHVCLFSVALALLAVHQFTVAYY